MKKILILVSLITFSACRSDHHFENGKPLKANLKNESSDHASGDTAFFVGDEILIARDSFDTKVFDGQKQMEDKDIVKTSGGVEIRFVEHGNGFNVEKGNVVKIKYQGKLPDGKIFDSSDMIGRALPIYVGIGMSVKGWDEALVNMRAGDKVTIKVPGKLAYGKRGYGKLIPPDTDLTFDMEVVEIMSPEITKSGLQIYRIFESAGKVPKDGNKITMHFYGWLRDKGELFDASHMNGKPYSFILGQGRSIPGWDEALKTMHRGEKVILVVSPDLAYGDAGIPELVPPKSTLIYQLELLEVE